MKRGKKLKVSSTAMFVILFLIGFGSGFGIKEFSSPQRAVTLQQPQQNSSSADIPISVCFTPNKQCQLQIINEINKARKSIYVQAYSFTDQGIAEALVSAFKRGVHVKVILDKSNVKDGRSAKDAIIQNQIPIRFDYPSGIAHNKIIVIDNQLVITGSYNFSAAAYTRNTENLLLINNSKLAHDYIENWLKRWDLSQSWRPLSLPAH